MTIIGPKCEGFEDSIKTISQMQAVFSRHFKQENFNSWVRSFAFGEVGISTSNHYFQHRGETLPDDLVPLGEHVDPFNPLKAAAAGSYCHTISTTMWSTMNE